MCHVCAWACCCTLVAGRVREKKYPCTPCSPCNTPHTPTQSHWAFPMTTHLMLLCWPHNLSTTGCCLGAQGSSAAAGDHQPRQTSIQYHHLHLHHRPYTDRPQTAGAAPAAAAGAKTGPRAVQPACAAAWRARCWCTRRVRSPGKRCWSDWRSWRVGGACQAHHSPV